MESVVQLGCVDPRRRRAPPPVIFHTRRRVEVRQVTQRKRRLPKAISILGGALACAWARKREGVPPNAPTRGPQASPNEQNRCQHRRDKEQKERTRALGK